jgi:hypothetical protein
VVKVAILGFAKSSRDLAPFNDPSWSIWGCNGTWAIAPRLDRLFDLHAPWIHEFEMRRPAGHVAWMQQFSGPIYLIDARADIPTSRAYPLAEVVQHLGRPYLTSSISMMLALAIMEGATEIGLYGIEMQTASEYADQRPGLEYLLGRAEERGITITLPDGCNILSGSVYGRGDLNDGGERLTPDQFRRRMATLVKRVGELERQAARQDGALREAALHAPTGHSRLESLQTELGETLDTLARVRGMVSEAQFWAAQTPEGASQDRFRRPSPVTLPQRPTEDRGLLLVKGHGA